MKRTLFPSLSVAAVLFASGCSTIVNHGRASGIDVRSDPSGAEIYLDGVPKGRTPARIDIDGGSAEHVVRLEKAGVGTFERTVSKKTDPWVWGNVPFAVFPVAAVAGFGIDAWCGRWYRVEPAELDVSFGPSSVPSPAPPERKRPTPAVSPAATRPSPPKTEAVAEKTELRTSGGSAKPAPSDDLDDLLRAILEND